MKRREFLKATACVAALATAAEGQTHKAGYPPADFVCKRCGRGCMYNVPEDYWLRSDITEAQKQAALAERAKYPHVEGCGMLVFEADGRASCIIHKLFGRYKKPIQCQKFPYENPKDHCWEIKKYRVDKFFVDEADDTLKVRLKDNTIHPICPLSIYKLKG